MITEEDEEEEQEDVIINFPAYELKKCTFLTSGSGEMLQLGILGDVYEIDKPRPITGFKGEDAIWITCGGGTNAVITNTNGVRDVWTFGCNDNYALGRETKSDEEQIVADKIPDFHGKDIVQISCGDNHMAALQGNGKLYTWGTYRDANGILGFKADREEMKVLKPELMEEFKDLPIKQVVSGDNTTTALDINGHIWQWGDTRLGHRVSSRGNIKMNSLTPSRVLITSIKFDEISCGSYHYFGKSTKGKWYSWGLNNFGQCGLGEPITEAKKRKGLTIEQQIMVPAPKPIKFPANTPNVIKIVGGQHHTLALTEGGHVYGWGKGEYGQIGHETEQNHVYPKLVEFFENQEVFGENNRPVAVIAAANHSFVMTANGDTYCFGFSNGALGIGEPEGEEQIEIVKVPLSPGMLKLGKIVHICGGAQHTLFTMSDEPTDKPCFKFNIIPNVNNNAANNNAANNNAANNNAANNNAANGHAGEANNNAANGTAAPSSKGGKGKRKSK